MTGIKHCSETREGNSSTVDKVCHVIQSPMAWFPAHERILDVVYIFRSDEFVTVINYSS